MSTSPIINGVRRLMLIIPLPYRRISRWQTAELPWCHQTIRYQKDWKRRMKRNTSVKPTETPLSLAKWVFVPTFISAEICLLISSPCREKGCVMTWREKLPNWESYEGYDGYGNMPDGIRSHSREYSEIIWRWRWHFTSLKCLSLWSVCDFGQSFVPFLFFFLDLSLNLRYYIQVWQVIIPHNFQR